MDKYTFIFNNNKLQEQFYNYNIKRDIDNPFNNIIINNEDFIRLCKNYFYYSNLKPEIQDKLLIFDDISFIYNGSIDEFNILLKKSKLKTPFFIFEKEKFNNIQELQYINNILFITILDEIQNYFKNKDAIVYHVYALCYNESRLLPYFLNHYKTADRIIIYDNNSTDNSVDIIKSYNREYVSFDSNETFNDTLHQSIKNSVWKQSKGIADFVIVQDLDEFLHFPEYPYDFKKGLFELNKLNPTFVVCEGYDMTCSDDHFKNIPIDQPIFNYINCGAYNKNYCKPNIINPNVLIETNWTVGNHGIKPIPNLDSTNFNILLLHYKHTGPIWEIERRLLLKNKLEKCYHGFGTEYLMDREQTIEYVNKFYTNSIDLKDKIFKKKITGSVIEHEFENRGLAGGIGNRLFNIFTVLSLSIKYGLYPFFILRPHNIIGYEKKLFRNLNIVEDYDLNKFLKIIEPTQSHTLNFDTLINNNRDILIQGYCQDSMYFDSYKDKILNEYLYLNNEDTNIVNDYINNLMLKYNKKLVGIHVRRGDYVQLKWDLSLEYYKKCISYFNTDEYDFIIFTDDKEWCKNNFIYEICDINIDYIELFVMSKMNALIMSNSTFSWWAAYIGNIQDVLCPYPWFKNTIFNKNIYLKKWIKINS